MDLRLSLRRLAQSPGFSLATISMLGLGIALSVAMFGVVRGVLLGSLPYPDSDRVVVVGARNLEQGVSNGLLTPAEALRLAGADGPFEAFGYYTWGGLTVLGDQRPREFETVNVSAGFFPALGVQPLLGRWFSAEEYAAGSDAVVLSHHEWQRLLGGDPQAVGRSIDTPDGRLRVVGVMPAGFDTPDHTVGAWRPFDPFNAAAKAQPWFWNARYVQAIARLPADREVGVVVQRLDALAAEVRAQYSMPDQGWQLRPTPVLDVLIGEVRPVLWGSLGVALLVLLIGCANVAILVDARQVARRHEQALAQALGASRGRLYGGLLLEIGLLTLAAVALGVGLAWLGIDALRELARDSLPRVDAIAIDSSVLAFAVALGLLLPFIAVVAGSLRLRGEASEAIRGGGKGVVAGSHAGRRSSLPALGVALSTISLAAAGGLLLSLMKLQQVDPGFRSEHVHALQVFRAGGRSQWLPFATEMQARLAALPGVEAVALSTSTPLSPIGSFNIDLQVRGRAQPEPFQVGLRRVSPGYLDLLGIPLVAGRGIEAADGAGSEPVAVINQTLARRVFGAASPLDQSIGLPLGQGERVYYRVVGVMADARNDGLRSASAPELLVSFAQAPWVGMTFLVRTARALPGIEQQMAEQVWAIDPQEAISRQFTLQGEIDAQLRAARFFARTVGAFALAALLLAALGVYAVAALQQQRRVGEFGLRLAVGARPLALALQVLREALRTVAFGLVLGLVGAWAALRLLQAQLFGIDGAQPLVLGSGVAVLGLAALCAALLPAWRAARVQPMQALRWE